RWRPKSALRQTGRRSWTAATSQHSIHYSWPFFTQFDLRRISERLQLGTQLIDTIRADERDRRRKRLEDIGLQLSMLAQFGQQMLVARMQDGRAPQRDLAVFRGPLTQRKIDI